MAESTLDQNSGNTFNPGYFKRVGRFANNNIKLTAGLAMVLVVLLFGYAGPIFVDMANTEVGSVTQSLPPNSENLLGTDAMGRDMLAWLIEATPASLRVGLLAGALGVAFGVTIALVGGYYGGFIDNVLRTLTDVMLTIPGLLVLIVLASAVRVVSLEMMALIIALFAWMGPARVIRSQVLTLRERSFVELSKLSGESNMTIIFRELMPNLMPYILASFVGAVLGSILAATGLEFLGLGPANISTLGNILFWQDFYNALIRGMYWWWGPPIVIFILLFTGLFLASMGLDEWANPRLKERA
ncbi:MAG: ABC transporter permease [Dehalococcoidia bacterium]|nr:ABC transporter permease [Dehalococcoidia bacterium]